MLYIVISHIFALFLGATLAAWRVAAVWRKRTEDQVLTMQQARDNALVTVKQTHEFLANISHEIRTPMNGVRIS